MSSGRGATERAYDDYLARVARGEQLEFDEFCAQHRAIEPELRALHALARRIAAIMPGRSPAQRIAERFGSESDPQVTLLGDEADEDLDDASGFSSEVIGRLAERTGAYGRYVL